MRKVHPVLPNSPWSVSVPSSTCPLTLVASISVRKTYQILMQERVRARPSRALAPALAPLLVFPLLPLPRWSIPVKTPQVRSSPWFPSVVHALLVQVLFCPLLKFHW